MSEHMCPACWRHRLHRIVRRTFAERFIYPLFGQYPWTCNGCRTRVVYKDRGGRKIAATRAKVPKLQTHIRTATPDPPTKRFGFRDSGERFASLG